MAVVTKGWLNRTDLLMPSTPSTRLGKPHKLSEHGDRNVIPSQKVFSRSHTAATPTARVRLEKHWATTTCHSFIDPSCQRFGRPRAAPVPGRNGLGGALAGDYQP